MSRSAKRELACNHVDLVQILVVVAMILLRMSSARDLVFSHGPCVVQSTED